MGEKALERKQKRDARIGERCVTSARDVAGPRRTKEAATGAEEEVGLCGSGRAAAPGNNGRPRFARRTPTLRRPTTFTEHACPLHLLFWVTGALR
ncbi:Hypothetical protein NTJ_00462 [Nesidiocoris tenuis]|uniref:Uncharacterized protein n=1 Tax=Nesidiocoris tenuis TaxID=355587 RepID=A0ABN7A602_9HEMI|nr:Hypothetical protein NTJ_00462 [Nesidiocoris tenuis]